MFIKVMNFGSTEVIECDCYTVDEMPKCDDSPEGGWRLTTNESGYIENDRTRRKFQYYIENGSDSCVYVMNDMGKTIEVIKA